MKYSTFLRHAVAILLQVKDVRTGEETSNAAAVMDGDIDDFVQAYLRHKGRRQEVDD